MLLAEPPKMTYYLMGIKFKQISLHLKGLAIVIQNFFPNPNFHSLVTHCLYTPSPSTLCPQISYFLSSLCYSSLFSPDLECLPPAFLLWAVPLCLSKPYLLHVASLFHADQSVFF